MASLADLLAERRHGVELMERRMQEAFDAACTDYPGSLRKMARDMGMTAAYLSDIRKGRRKVSGAVVTQLVKVMK